MSQRRSMFPTPTMNQEAFYGSNDYTSYLSSLMQSLTLSNNYQGEFDLPDQCQLSNAAPDYAKNYYCQTSYEQPVIGNNMGLDYYHQYPSASSSGSSSEFNFWTSNTQSPAIYPSAADRITGDFGTSKHYDGAKLLEDVCINPYAVMFDSGRFSEFMKLLQNCTKTVLDRILKKMAESHDNLLIVASCDSHAFQVLRKLINAARKVPSVSRFPRIFAANVVYLMNHQQARLVLQECFVSLDKFMNEPLYEKVMENWWKIATTKYGCISLPSCIDYMDSSPVLLSYERMVYAPSFKERLLMDISKNAASLALDIYGNYVLQHVMVMNYPNCNEIIAKVLRPLYETLCTNKRGSFLVEKCSGTHFRTCVAEELLNSKRLVKIVQHQYGNYVIQKLLKETKEHDVLLYEKLYKRLLQDLTSFECSLFGRNVAYLIKDQLKEDEANGYEVQMWQKEVDRLRRAAFVEKR